MANGIDRAVRLRAPTLRSRFFRRRLLCSAARFLRASSILPINQTPLSANDASFFASILRVVNIRPLAHIRSISMLQNRPDTQRVHDMHTREDDQKKGTTDQLEEQKTGPRTPFCDSSSARQFFLNCACDGMGCLVKHSTSCRKPPERQWTKMLLFCVFLRPSYSFNLTDLRDATDAAIAKRQFHPIDGQPTRNAIDEAAEDGFEAVKELVEVKEPLLYKLGKFRRPSSAEKPTDLRRQACFWTGSIRRAEWPPSANPPRAPSRSLVWVSSPWRRANGSKKGERELPRENDRHRFYIDRGNRRKSVTVPIGD